MHGRLLSAWLLLCSSAASAAQPVGWLNCSSAALTQAISPWRCPFTNRSGSLDLLQSCNGAALGRARQVLVVNLDADRSNNAYAAALRRYNRTRPPGSWPIDITQRPLSSLTAGISWDVLLTGTGPVGDLYDSDSIIPIDGDILSTLGSVESNWLAVDAALRTQCSMYGTSPLSVVLGGAPTHLFYRHDILKKAGVSPNYLSTWGGVVAVALNLTGKDWDGDGFPEHGFCFNRGLDAALTATIQLTSPIVQTKGPNEGVLINADTGQLLMGFASARLSLLFYQRLVSVAPSIEAFVRENQPNDAFLRGRCIMTISSSPYPFKMYSQSRSSRVRGKFLVLPSPGSDVVLDRNSNTLVPCDDLTCPFADLEGDPPDPSAPSKLFVNYTRLLGLNETTKAVLNLRPGEDLLSGPAGYISSKLSQEGRAQAMQVLNFLSSSETSWSLVLDQDTDISPYRNEHFKDMGGTPPSTRWLAAGYDPVATPSFLQALTRAVGWSSNVAAILQFPSVSETFTQLIPLIADLNSVRNISEFTDRVAQSFTDSAVRIFGSWEKFVAVYKFSLSYQEVPRQNIYSPPPPQQYIPAQGWSGSSRETLIVSVSVGLSVPLTCVLVAAGTIWVLRNKRRHLNLLGRVRMPACAPDTTIVVATIQGFDTLYDTCERDVCEAVMGIWEDLVKTLLTKHMGFQLPTSTPGCLRAAFHTPADATWFAFALHQHLLQAKWPRELLSVPEFAPTYMVPSGLMREASVHHGVPPSRSLPHFATTDPNSNATMAVTSPSFAPVPAVSGPRSQLSTVTQGLDTSTQTFVADTSTTFRDYCAARWIQLQHATAHDSVPEGATGPQSALQAGASQPLPFTRSLGVNRSITGQVQRLQASEPLPQDAVLVTAGLQACISLCAVCSSKVERVKDTLTGRKMLSGQAVEIAESIASADMTGGTTLVPQQTFRQLPIEVMSEKHLFCHLGEYQFNAELMPLDVYLALPKSLFCRLGTLKPLRPRLDGRAMAPGVLSAPMDKAAMVFTHIVGVQTLLSWNYELASSITEIFTRLAGHLLRLHSGYLVEHVSGFMLSAFQDPGAAIQWATHLQQMMMEEPWTEELLSHELCEEVYVDSVSGLQASEHDDTQTGGIMLHRGPRLKSGIAMGPILAALNTVTGRMAYRGKVMNRAARIASLASSGQVLCSAEALDAAGGSDGINARQVPASRHSPVTHPFRDVRSTRREPSLFGGDFRETQSRSKAGLQQAHMRAKFGGPSVEDVETHRCSRAVEFIRPQPCHSPALRLHFKDLGLVSLKGVAEQVQIHLCSTVRRDLDIAQAKRNSQRSDDFATRSQGMPSVLLPAAHISESARRHSWIVVGDKSSDLDTHSSHTSACQHER